MFGSFSIGIALVTMIFLATIASKITCCMYSGGKSHSFIALISSLGMVKLKCLKNMIDFILGTSRD